MRRWRYAFLSVSDAKSDLRTDAILTRHSSATLLTGGAVSLYTSNISCIVAGSSMSERQLEGTWIVPISSVDSSREVPTKSYDRQASTSDAACSFSLASLCCDACSSWSACSDTWKMFSSALCLNDTAILRCAMSEVPGDCWFISVTSWLKIFNPMW